MEEWKEYKLGDVCDITIGRTPPRAESKWFNPSADFYNWISIKDMGVCGKHISSTSETISIEGQKRFNIPLVLPDTVILSFKLTVGRVAITSNKIMLTNEAIAQLPIIDKNLLDKDFLYYSLKNFNFSTLGSTSSIATAVNSKMIKEIAISFPPLPKQHKIASILSSLDDKIEVNRRINENLEQQAQALFKSWFVDFEPFKDGVSVESELGMIPKGWRVKEAQDVFEINIGKTPPRKESEWFTESKEDNIWVSIADMSSCGVFISDSSECLTNEAIKRFNIMMVEKDSVLLSFKLTVGRVAIADTSLTTNEAIARFILPDKCYREYLYLYLKQYKYENLGSTSSIATAVNSKTIKGMKLIVPPTDIIKSFSKNTKPLFEQIRVLQQESNRLAELRDTLLPKLMSGEIKVLHTDLINEMLEKGIR